MKNKILLFFILISMQPNAWSADANLDDWVVVEDGVDEFELINFEDFDLEAKDLEIAKLRQEAQALRRQLQEQQPPKEAPCVQQVVSAPPPPPPPPPPSALGSPVKSVHDMIAARKAAGASKKITASADKKSIDMSQILAQHAKMTQGGAAVGGKMVVAKVPTKKEVLALQLQFDQLKQPSLQQLAAMEQQAAPWREANKRGDVPMDVRKVLVTLLDTLVDKKQALLDAARAKKFEHLQKNRSAASTEPAAQVDFRGSLKKKKKKVPVPLPQKK